MARSYRTSHTCRSGFHAAPAGAAVPAFGMQRERLDLKALTLEEYKSELLADFAQVARNSALVLHHASAADDLQVGDARKIGQDLVQHAISKVGVGFLLA